MTPGTFVRCNFQWPPEGAPRLRNGHRHTTHYCTQARDHRPPCRCKGCGAIAPRTARREAE